jgi:hypothetical protein
VVGSHVQRLKNAVVTLSVLQHIRSVPSGDAAQPIGCSVVGAKLDRSNSRLDGALASTCDRLQRVQYQPARIVTRSSRRADAESILRKLHWLPIRQGSSATRRYSAMKSVQERSLNISPCCTCITLLAVPCGTAPFGTVETWLRFASAPSRHRTYMWNSCTTPFASLAFQRRFKTHLFTTAFDAQFLNCLLTKRQRSFPSASFYGAI